VGSVFTSRPYKCFEHEFYSERQSVLCTAQRQENNVDAGDVSDENVAPKKKEGIEVLQSFPEELG
jgi:hypothetical protein